MMTTRSENWSVNYLPRISHPRPPIQLADDAAHGPEDPNSNQPPLGSTSPLPRPQNPTRPSLLLLPGRPCRPVAGGRSDDHGRVRFDSVVQLILVPSRKDMHAALSQELWWNQEDYLQFRLGAIVEDNAGLLRRPLRKKRSRRAQPTRASRAACPPDPRLAQALQSRSSSMRPVRQHFKFHSPPSYGASPPLRVQPSTPPPSPEKQPVCATASRVDESPAESAPSARPTGGERGPVEYFDGFVSVCGLPGSIATVLEC